MRSAFLAFMVTVAACVLLLAACFNKSKSSEVSYDGGLPDVLAPGVNLPDAGTARYSVGGNVTGLTGTGLVLEATGSDFGVTATQDVDVAPSAGGAAVKFTFKTLVPEGLHYTVVVKTQPSSPSQNCKVVAGVGTVPRANVTDIAVNCSTTTFVISGTATGVQGNGLILDDNGGDPLAVSNGNFAFLKLLPSGSKYAVTVAKSPGFPSETCTVTQGSGTVTTMNVTSVKVNCVPNVFNVGGNVVGLVGSGLVLTDNGTDNLNVTANGPFVFPSPVTSGSPFGATITIQPSNPSQTCSVAAASGTVEDGDISTIVVNCSQNTFTVSGTVNGLAGGGLVLNTSAGFVNISSNGTFALPAALANGATYSVSIEVNPTNPTQSCSVSGGSGAISGANVTGVDVECTTGTFTVGGQVSGLASGTMAILTDNGGDNLVVGANGGFTFPTPLSSGSVYDIAVTSPPGETCAVSSGGSGVIASMNVANVAVRCTASGDFCADAQTDPNNCGGCAIVCPAGQSCQSGGCACPNGGDTECQCANENTDPNNCGRCGNSCGVGQTCVNGACMCPVPDVLCPGGVCVDPQTDPNNCGRCGNMCNGGQTCQARFTESVAAGPSFGCACPSPTQLCNDACLDERSDPNNCGRCGLQCPSNLPVCSGSTCVTGCPATTPTLCGPGQCVDTTSDPNNCGTCGNACPEGLSCANSSCCPANQIVCDSACVDDTVDGNCGACGVTCAPAAAGPGCSLNPTTGQYGCCSGTETQCNGACTDTSSDVGNCGGCGPNPFSAVAVPSPFVCTGVSPACCSSSCSDTASDPNNCFGCGNVCPSDPNGFGVPVCGGNGCTLDCQGLSNCNGACTDTTSDPTNCGNCADGSANVCPAPDDPNAVPTCVESTCGFACNSGYTLCADTGLCTATATDPGDPNNCGGCDNVCPVPQNGQAACFPGTSGGDTCGVNCNEGFVACGNACVNLSTDNANCGGCDIPCPGAQTCQGTQCVCPIEGQVLCNGVCVDPTSDSSNCGACSNACPEGLSCQNSSCCPTGQNLCGGVCVNEQTDSQNCNGCGSACPAGTACTNGNCCGNGQQLCNSACVNVQADPNNCGACGATCPAGVACQAGSCCTSPQILCGPNAGRSLVSGFTTGAAP